MADRFIIGRVGKKQSMVRSYMLTSNTKSKKHRNTYNKNYHNKLFENIFNINSEARYGRILQPMKHIPVKRYTGIINELDNCLKHQKEKKKRIVKSKPKNIFDAPNIVNDYYYSILDWSRSNMIYIALFDDLYYLNPISGEHSLIESISSEILEFENEKISSISYNNCGADMLAVGTSVGILAIIDPITDKLKLSIDACHSRITGLSWMQKSQVVYFGTKSGKLGFRDFRSSQENFISVPYPRVEICGLSIQPGDCCFATGDNSNRVMLWDVRNTSEPTHTFKEHKAAVKTLSWAPSNPNLLATGGGTADCNICIWNVTTGNLLSKKYTGSQVCNIHWSKQYDELVSTHGYTGVGKNTICLWQYPSLDLIKKIKAHDQRVLFSSMSPSGEFLATAAADETLKIWNLFPPEERKQTGYIDKQEGNIYAMGYSKMGRRSLRSPVIR